MTSEKQKLKMLNLRETLAVSGWLSANAETMKVSTRDQRAAAIKKALSIDVTVNNLAHIERELGFTNWERPVIPRGAVGDPAHVDRVRVVAVAVSNLYVQLGLTVPPLLVAVRSGRRPSEEELRTFLDDLN